MIIRGVYDYSRIKDLPQLLIRLFEVSPHVWSSNTQKYFPFLFRSFYSPPSPLPSSSSSSLLSSPSQIFTPSVSSPSISFLFNSTPSIPSSSSSSSISPTPILTTGFYPPPPLFSSLSLSFPPNHAASINSTVSPIATFQRVAEELEHHTQYFNAMDQHIHPFVNHFHTLSQNKPLFLCEV